MRKKKRTSFIQDKAGIPRETLFGAVGGLVLILVLVVVGLQVLIGMKLGEKSSLEKQVADLGDGKGKVDAVIQDLKKYREKVANVEKATHIAKISWAQKLNEISDNLPRGLWLTRIIYEVDTFRIHGASVSKTENELIPIHRFVANLQKSDAFSDGLENIELGLIKKEMVNTTSVANFTISADVPGGQ